MKILKECIANLNEAKMKPQKKLPITFELDIDGERIYTGDNADMVDKKLKQKKNVGKDFKVMRSHGNDYEDVTHLFV